LTERSLFTFEYLPYIHKILRYPYTLKTFSFGVV